MRLCALALTILSLLLSEQVSANDCQNLTRRSDPDDLIKCIRDIDRRSSAVSSTTWNSIERTVLGKLPKDTNNTITLSLPSQVPKGAREILVYVWIYSGNAQQAGSAHFEIFTQAGDTKFSKFFYWSRYTQSAVSFNSDNMWFPLTSERRLFIRLDGQPVSSIVDGEVWLIGYR